jgi:hypothetical protein
MRHHAGEVVEAAPEVVELFRRGVDGDRFADVDAALARQGVVVLAWLMPSAA